MTRNRVSPSVQRALLAAPIGLLLSLAAPSSEGAPPAVSPQDQLITATPIKHLVVIYGENVSFDHYFGSYPYATNPSGEPVFTAAAGTPTVNGLVAAGTSLSTSPLMINNPNLNPANGSGAANPFRLDRSQAGTADQNHAYTAEEQGYDDGLADLFPYYTGAAGSGGAGAFDTKGLVMGYFDGNTVSAYWNYAQHFAMNDNAYTASYGPSTPGALNVVSGQTNGINAANSTIATLTSSTAPSAIADGQGGYTEIGDADPYGDICSSTSKYAQLSGKNIGDLLNAASISWGGFMGGFNLNTVNANGTTGCKRSSTPAATTPSGTTADYVQHHNWFQYYASTANPTHARPSAATTIGYSVEADGKTPEPANHEYDTNDFFAAVAAGNFPSVSYLKAPAIQDGHAGYSDPIDEQMFATEVVNFLQQQPDWKNTVVIVTYDDSDGWYDHAYASPTRFSSDMTVTGQKSTSGKVLAGGADQLNGPGVCGTPGAGTTGVDGGAVNGRCGPGTRIPFLVISPWAKQNYVDHTLIDQASVVRFIEDNWLGGQRLGGGSFDAVAGSIMGMFNFNGKGGTAAPLYLDQSGGATQGTPVSTPPALPSPATL